MKTYTVHNSPDQDPFERMKDIKLAEQLGDMWEELTGESLDLSQDNYGIITSTKEYRRMLQIVLDHNHDMFLLLLVLEGMLYDYLSKCQVEMVDVIMNRDEEFERVYSVSKKFMRVLKDNKYYERKEKVMKNIKGYLSLVGYSTAKIDPYFEKTEKMFEVLDLYFKNICRFEVHQFAKGEFNNIEPYISKNVITVKDASSAIAYAKYMPGNYFSLVGVVPDARESGYFAYVIKNGENIYMLTDINRSTHNAHGFSDRHDTYREIMPYVMLGEWEYVWEVKDIAGQIHQVNQDKYYIAPKDRNWDQFKLSELEPHEVLYQALMFDYVKAKFFRLEKITLPELSYTAHDININHQGLDINLLPALHEKSIDIDLPSIESVRDELLSDLGNPAHLMDIADQVTEDTADIFPTRIDNKLITFQGNEIQSYNPKDHTNMNPIAFSQKFFGTPDQTREMVKNTMKGNITRKLQDYHNIDYKTKLLPEMFEFIAKHDAKPFRGKVWLRKNSWYGLSEDIHPDWHAQRERIIRALALKTEYIDKGLDLEDLPFHKDFVVGKIIDKSIRSRYKGECLFSDTISAVTYIIDYKIKYIDDYLYLFNLKYEDLPRGIQLLGYKQVTKENQARKKHSEYNWILRNHIADGRLDINIRSSADRDMSDWDLRDHNGK